MEETISIDLQFQRNMVIEYGGEELYPSSATFIFSNVTHTLANPVKFTLNQDPRVSSCGYTIPTPDDEDPQYDPPRDPPLNFRVQTTGDDARDVFKDAVQELLLMCKHVRSTFDQSVADFKNSPSFPSSSSSFNSYL